MEPEPTFCNPFAPVDGSIPLALAGRSQILERFERALEGMPGNQDRLTVIAGTRGSGKSAVLGAFAERARACGWLALRVTDGDDLIPQVLQLAALESLKLGGALNLEDLLAFCDRLAEQPHESPVSLGTALRAILDRLGSACKGMLLCIDDISGTNPALLQLLQAIHQLMADGLNVALAVAALPRQAENLLAEPRASLLACAAFHQLSQVTPQQAEEALQETAEAHGRRFSANALATAVRNVNGSVKRIQLIGFHAWNRNPEGRIISIDDVNHGIREADEDMARSLRQSVLAGLSPKDLSYLQAMAADDDVSLASDVAQRMGVAPNYARIYKKRLADLGIICSAGRGKVAFEIPELRDFLRQEYNR